MRKALIVSVGILLCLVSSGLTATHYIKPDGTGDFPTIQDGINAAVAGDIVLLAAGTYTGVGNRDIDFLGKAITVTSESGAEVTIIDCQNSGRGFFFHSGEGFGSVVAALTITDGFSNTHGGGIHCDHSSPTITGNTITDNFANFGGGGVYCDFSSPTITNNTITGNTGGNGGGIFGFQDSSPTITNNAITGNFALQGGGGGINFAAGTPPITGNTISGNSTLGNGGGIALGGASPTISNNTITENTATLNGGGISCAAGTPPITDNTLNGNTAELRGGGIYCVGSPSFPDNTISGNTITRNSSQDGGGICCRNSSPSITNNTITGNSGSGNGGGIFCGDGSSPAIDNTIIAFSSQGVGVYCDATLNPTITCCDIYGNAGGDALCGIDGGGNFSADPEFCGISESSNYYLQSDSPCAPGNHPSGNPCGLIGAWPVGCGTVSTKVKTWGEIKTMYEE